MITAISYVMPANYLHQETEDQTRCRREREAKQKQNKKVGKDFYLTLSEVDDLKNFCYTILK